MSFNVNYYLIGPYLTPVPFTPALITPFAIFGLMPIKAAINAKTPTKAAILQKRNIDKIFIQMSFWVGKCKVVLKMTYFHKVLDTRQNFLISNLN